MKPTDLDQVQREFERWRSTVSGRKRDVVELG